MESPIAGAAPAAPTGAAPAAPSASDPTTAAGAATTGGEPVTNLTTVNSLGDLRKKAPKVFGAMMMGIAQNICYDMKHHDDTLKEMMRKARQDSGEA